VIRPPRLQPGARVAVVAPAGPVPREDFAAGAAILGARYLLVHDERIFARSGFLAGDDDARLGELQRALDDPELRAIFCARGGYGLTRILHRLDPAGFLRAPKPIVGFSDVTALHAWSLRQGVTAVHGPVITQLGRLPRENAEALFALLESPAPPRFPDLAHGLVAGVAEGRLVAGNLELLSRLVGTPFAVDFTDSLLLLEEVGERPYRIDRSLTQLISSGAFTGLRGAIVGDLHNCRDKDEPPGASAVVHERLGTLGIPIASGAPVGHGNGWNWPVPVGARARLTSSSAGNARLELLEGAVD
jgi:muramoyltetrapeptide carboxypeptidase